MKGEAMEWEDVKRKLLKNKERRKAYGKIELGYEIGKMITDARIARNMTQGKLAQLVGTKQPSIARLEKGKALPSLMFLQKIAEAFDTQLLPPRLQFLEEEQISYTIHKPISIVDYDLDWSTRISTGFIGLTHTRGAYDFGN